MKVLDQPGSVDHDALTMALAIVIDRIRRLPPEDKNDLYELVTALGSSEAGSEEQESIVLAMREILAQAPAAFRPLEVPPTPGDGLAKWMTWIGEQIRKHRKAASLTQEELAEKSGLPQSHISRLENGQHSPSRVTLERIANALAIPRGELDPSA